VSISPKTGLKRAQNSGKQYKKQVMRAVFAVLTCIIEGQRGVQGDRFRVALAARFQHNFPAAFSNDPPNAAGFVELQWNLSVQILRFCSWFLGNIGEKAPQ